MVEAREKQAATLDAESAEWISALAGDGFEREAGLARLHDLLIRVAVRELRRREAPSGIGGQELGMRDADRAGAGNQPSQ